MTARERAHGALLGLAVGDALGMPSQNLPRETIAARWGLLDGFEPGPDDNAISRGLPAGRVTDDTDQAVLLGEALVAGGGALDPSAFAQALLEWEARMRAAGSLDLLGPSTRRALDEFEAGVPASQTGRAGTTNGAAMRIAPVGVAVAPAPAAVLVDAVRDASRVTHDTGVAIAGAAAVAAAVSVGVSGGSAAEALAASIEAASIGARWGHWTAAADVAARIRWAVGLTRGRGVEEVLSAVSDLVGTSVATQESVPAAFAVAAAFGDEPWLAVRVAASVGGDCDTIAAMVGAMTGSRLGPDAFPEHVRGELAAANPGLALEPLAAALLALREE